MYIIQFTDTDKLPIVIYEEQIDNTTVDVTLIGKSTMEYGELFNENVLHLLENFASVENANVPGTPDNNLTLGNLLQNPIEGQFWYNKTTSVLHYWDGSKWVPMFIRNNIATNSGTIIHGQQIPLPEGITSYDECSWFVTPQYIDQNSNYIECYTNSDAVVSMRYRPTGTSTLIAGVANFIIIGMRNSDHSGIPYPIPSVPMVPSPTPTPTITPTVTPTTTPAPAASVTPTVTRTPTFTPTRTATMSPSLTPAPTVTRTPTPTPSNTPPMATSVILTTALSGYIDPTIGYIIGYATDTNLQLGYGSLFPPVHRGYPITALSCSYSFGLYNFGIEIMGDVSANFISSIRFIDNTGTVRIFNSNNAATGPGLFGTFYWTWSVSTMLFNVGTNYAIQIYA